MTANIKGTLQNNRHTLRQVSRQYTNMEKYSQTCNLSDTRRKTSHQQEYLQGFIQRGGGPGILTCSGDKERAHLLSHIPANFQ